MHRKRVHTEDCVSVRVKYGCLDSHMFISKVGVYSWCQKLVVNNMVFDEVPNIAFVAERSLSGSVGQFALIKVYLASFPTPDSLVFIRVLYGETVDEHIVTGDFYSIFDSVFVLLALMVGRNRCKIRLFALQELGVISSPKPEIVANDIAGMNPQDAIDIVLGSIPLCVATDAAKDVEQASRICRIAPVLASRFTPFKQRGHFDG
mmetsp:Transcript_32002/g.52862  ORF Transcript_32002/g.52862 Transcript_32002/m.52862 type:complete len:205 (-) Transcript_32002:1220-1834(-)